METFDDVTLVVEGHNIECSKAILAQHSEYFKIMFEGHFSERNQNIITMYGVDFESFRICIRMLENSFKLEEEHLPMVLQTASMLQFQELTEIIGRQLINNLNVDNCLDVWFLTEPMNLRPVYLRAKHMAMVEFNMIKDRDALLKLDMEDLHNYLANVHLLCNEFDVFCAFMKWSFVNDNKNMMVVLSYLDFNRLTDDEIADMLKYPVVRNSMELFDVLKSIILIRNGIHVENDLAQKLLKCNRRGYWGDPLFFEADEKHEVADDDSPGVWDALLIWMDQEYFSRNVEYKLVRNKQQFRLLSYKYHNGEFYYSIWTFDNVRKHWDKNPPLMINYEIFDLCFCKNALYIVGGIVSPSTDPSGNKVMNVFREDTLRYDVFLPKDGGNVKCCKYNDELFLFYNQLKRAYICNPDYKTFIQLKIVDEQHFPRMEGEFAIYCCNDRFFLKDMTRLVQLRVVSNKLHVEKETVLSMGPYEVRDKSLLCYDTVYTMRWNYNVLTVQSEMICRDQDDYRIGMTRYFFDTKWKMLMPDDHRLSKKDKYVNTMENLFGN